MFKVIARPKFTHVVPVQVPCDGGHEEQTMTVTYQLVPNAEEYDLRRNEVVAEFLANAVVGIDDLVDDAGKAVNFEMVRDQVMSLPYVRVGLLAGYFRAMVKAKPGN